MTDSLETIKNWWSPEIKYDWQKEHQETSNLAEIQKGIPHLHPMTIPDYKEKIGIAKKKLGLPEEQTEISEKSGLPEKSQGLATPRSKPLGLVQQHWQKNEGYHSKKWLIKGPVQSSNKKDLQSDAVYIHVLYSFTAVCLLVYPVPKPSRLVNCWISLKFTGKTIQKHFHL